MNKFADILSREHSEIRKSRAKNLAEEALYAQEEIIRSLEKKRRELTKTLLDLQDLSPDSTISLNVVKGDFNAEAWASKLQETQVELSVLKVEIEIANKTKRDFFGSEKE